ncbi:MAG: hypothetical protein M9899_10025 [Bdellovibrionaceae bacterium]|nr:hypothetical protein [Pseudobdellovibrionaceae bacterium]
MLLYEVIDILKSHRLKYALVGGYALALHGIIRATVDVDLVLNLTLSDFEHAEKALMKIGLKSRLPIRAQDVIKMRKEYIENRNLMAWSFVDYQNPSRQVDILITENLSDLDVESVSVSGRKISVVSLEGLLKMKLKSHRDKDQLDIKLIKEKLGEKNHPPKK